MYASTLNKEKCVNNSYVYVTNIMSGVMYVHISHNTFL